MICRLAVTLGAVKRKVGILHQGDPIDPISRRNRDTEARRGIRLLTVDHDRAIKAILEPIGQSREILGRWQVTEQNRELVASQSRDNGIAKHILKMRGHVAKQRIPGGVSERIVDDLEIVKIDVDDHQLHIVAAAQQGMIQLFDKQFAIGQIG
ncbi:outer membrane autotransporter barrel [Sphingopyxis sp. EG6]|nr:outer membrane autotransporter barrel [Sphingopyxis sp. EG6]